MILIIRNVGVEVFTAVVMKCTIFWDIMPCSPLKVNRRFGGTYRLHLQGRKMSRESSDCYLITRWYLARLIILS
jgi:hypothetical protein